MVVAGRGELATGEELLARGKPAEAIRAFEASARRHGHDPVRAWSSSGPLSWQLRLEPTQTELISITVEPRLANLFLNRNCRRPLT